MRKCVGPARTAAACALLISCLTGQAQESELLSVAYGEGQRPPNIVLILLDWARRDAIGAYGENPVQTPNIDALANEGVRFDNAYTPATLCSPARASIITGIYPHAHGIRKTMYPAGINGGLPTMYPDPIANPFDDERFNLAINFPKYLTNSGFATGHIGKWHLGTGNPGFFDLFKSYNSLMPHWVGEPQKSAYREDIQTNEGIRFVSQHAERPFFLYQSYYTPHGPYQAPEEYLDLYENSAIEHQNYYAAVSSVDANVGRLVASLEERGILDDTLIIISADHAGGFRDRPGSYRGMGIAYDEAARIPMIMHWPNGLPGGVVWNSGVSLVDLAPTILAAADINTKSRVMEIITGRIGSPFHGRDLIEEVRTGIDAWPSPVFMQNVPEAAIANSWFDERAMRYRQWKLTLRDFSADPRARGNSLFDLDSDPDEEKNLYHLPEYADVLAEQLEVMLTHARDLRDDLAVKLATTELDLLENPEKLKDELY
jgi:choline-sulfatase